MPTRIAICITTGIITATSGVLFMKAEAQATKAISTTIVARGRLPACRSAAPMTISTAPVRTSPPITRNISAMVHGAGFESTDTASGTGRRPRISMSAAPPMAVTSTG